jgi:LCP family protein required for cell wall assembly
VRLLGATRTGAYSSPDPATKTLVAHAGHHEGTPLHDETRAAARHAVGATRSIWAGVARVLLVMVTVVAVSSVSVAAYGAWHLSRKFQDNSVSLGDEPVPSISALKGAFNVLLVGADNAPGQHSFGEARDGTLNDVNILIHVSEDHSRATVVSLPRDLVIPHPQCTDQKTGEVFSAMSAQPLNTAFGRGGLGCVVATVESVTGLNIPYAALFSFEGTVKMADAVGGVPVCVNRAIDDPDSGLRLKKGVSVVKGRMALAYLRSRHGVGDGSDLSRIASQQAYMSSLMRKMTSAGTLSDPTKLYGLASATADSISLSESLANPDTMVQMALAVKSVDLDRMVFVQYPVTDDPVNPNKVVPNAALATALMDRVQQDAPIRLDKDALGLSTKLEKEKRKKAAAAAEEEESDPTASASPSATETADPDVLTGLRGQTAAQQTCSGAFGSGPAPPAARPQTASASSTAAGRIDAMQSGDRSSVSGQLAVHQHSCSVMAVGVRTGQPGYPCRFTARPR